MTLILLIKRFSSYPLHLQYQRTSLGMRMMKNILLICCFYVFIVTQSSARFHSRNLMRKETENLLTTFENQDSIEKHIFDTKVKARGRYIVILSKTFFYKKFDLSDWFDLTLTLTSSRVETELRVVVTALQSPDWYEENAEERKMKKLKI